MQRQVGQADRDIPPGVDETAGKIVLDKFPAGAWMNRALTLRTGQCHVQRYMKPLLHRIERGEIDPTRIITHTLPLDEAERGFEMFKNKQDNCEKVVLKP